MTSPYERQAEIVLELAARRADSAEVWCADSERIPVRFEDNKLQMLEASSSTGIALRVIADGKMGFAASTRESSEEDLVEMALSTAQFGTEVDYEFPGPDQYPVVKTYDPAVARLDADTMTETGEAILEKILHHESDVDVNVSLNRGVGRARLLNTSGVDMTGEGTSASIVCFATWVEGDSLLRTGDVLGSQFMYDDPEQVAERIIEQLDLGRRPAQISEGKYPVIFGPWVLGDILRPFLASVDGDAVAKGFSPWRDRIGEPVADERVSIYDDGLMHGGLATAPWDDEGVPSQCTPLVENGKLQNFLVDLRNAARLERPPTGNGQRGGLSSPPGVGTSNICVKAGERPHYEMIASVDEGILVHQLMGAWGSNPYGGQVSGNIALGFKIENGELVGRVKNTMLYLNAFDAWQDQLIEISSDVRQILSYRLPHVALDGVSISAQG